MRCQKLISAQASETCTYPEVSGEVEIELRWVRDESGGGPAAPLYKLHIRNMSASILESDSDFVLDGAARLGLHTALTKCAPINEKTLVRLDLCILRAASLDPSRVGIGHPFVIVRCNDSEVHRTPARWSTLSPTWSRGASVVCFQIPSVASGTPYGLSVEVWCATTSTARACCLGRIPLMPTKLLDHGREYEHQLLAGALILTWRQLRPKTLEFPAELKFSRDEAASSAAKELSYTLQISNWTVYPQTEGAYICASLGSASAISDEGCLELMAEPSCFTSLEELQIEVKSKGEIGHNSKCGECLIPLQAHWIGDKEPHQLVQMLTHTTSGLLGHLAFSIQVRCRRPHKAKHDGTRTTRELERLSVLHALRRSAEYAKRASQDAIGAFERAADSTERKALSATQGVCRREAMRAMSRLQHSIELGILYDGVRSEVTAGGAVEQRNGHKTKCAAPRSEITTGSAVAQQHASRETSCSARPSSLAIKHRELAHVRIDIRIDPTEKLGIIWGDVERDELAALVANRSGFSARVTSTPHARVSHEMSLQFANANDQRSRSVERNYSEADDMSEAMNQYRSTFSSLEPLLARISVVDEELIKLSAGSKSHARTLALRAGRNLTVLGLRKGMQAARLGVCLGWRAVSLNGRELGCREHLSTALNAPMEEMILTFTARIECRHQFHALRNLKRYLVATKRCEEVSQVTAAAREKTISLDLRKQLGISWTTATGGHGHSKGGLEVKVVMPNLDHIRGGMILTRVASRPVHDEEDFSDILDSLRSTYTYVVNFDFMLPRHVHKRVIFFDARQDFGALFQGDSILRLLPNAPATKARVRPGWILLSVNGLAVTGGASPVALLADLRRRASDHGDPFSQATTARHTELVFNVAVDDLISLFINPRNPGIDWTFLPRTTKENSSCNELGGDVFVKEVVNGTGRPKRGWRLIKIEYNNAQHFPASPGAMMAAFEHATNLGQEEVKVTFDCAEEDDGCDRDNVIGDGRNATPEDLVPPPEACGTRNLPVVELPVVEPSIYLHIIN